MLIYNSKKEFLGIDESDLQALGFSDLSELQAQANDFADMFVKTPGYIHNFQHVNWIDFVACADADTNSRVIINTNNKNFRSNIDVKTAFLNDDPSSKAFLVYLNNIIEVSLDGSNTFVDVMTEDTLKFTEPKKDKPQLDSKINEYNHYDSNIPKQEAKQENKQENKIITTYEKAEIEDNVEISLDNEDIKLEIEEEPVVEEKVLESVEQSVTEMEVFDNGYYYDPQIASSELGLPIDLIEEFIEDFIAQAKEFKGGLYSSLDNGDSENVKSLSHKLKGVAANLRIEDAFETLVVINTSDNHNEISEHLDTFYKIISKLSGEKIAVTKNKIVQSNELESVVEPVKEDLDEPLEIDIFSVNDKIEEPITQPKKELALEEDDLVLSFKDESISDHHVPSKIEMPELADDEFLSPASEDQIDVDDSIDIENISDEEIISLQDKSIEMDDIELLDDYEIEDDQSLDITLVEEPEIIEYNKKKIADEIGISLESFLTLFNEYIDEAKQFSSNISQAVKKDDYKQWRSKALGLQSMNESMRIETFADDLMKLIETKDSSVAKKASKKISQAINNLSKMDN
ncbi:Hpt domain-containing protein [Sulfurimonas sp.]